MVVREETKERKCLSLVLVLLPLARSSPVVPPPPSEDLDLDAFGFAFSGRGPLTKRRAGPVAAAANQPFELSYATDCPRLFARKLAQGNGTWPPPKFAALSEGARSAFTLGGRIAQLDYFLTDHFNGGKTNVWSDAKLAAAVAHLQSSGPKARREACLKGGGYNTTVHCDALRAFPPRGRGLVVGSQKPWLEAEILALGGGAVTGVTTHEFSPTRCTPNPKRLREAAGCHRVAVEHPLRVAERIAGGDPRSELGSFDFAVSYSSLEHDGLGRYGDPLDPFGDLLSVQMVHCLLKRGALLLLGFPCHATVDSLAWNAHRIYGPLRRALIGANFELVRVVGELARGEPEDWRQQPVLVLRKL